MPENTGAVFRSGDGVRHSRAGHQAAFASLHRGLIRSFPSLYGEKQALRGIPGSLPDLTDPPAGCVFAPRCPYATERCRQERPEIREYEPGHFAACHRCQEREAE
ncbi:MAG: oligopeptide/dipeptide ABC transporter ATP-binding protein [Lachnospiraceae bacterium]